MSDVPIPVASNSSVIGLTGVKEEADNGSSTAEYSPSTIIHAAETKASQGDIPGAEMLYQEALLNWVDDAREGSNDSKKMADAIADLWCAYAEFFRGLKKYKSCLEAFESATQCPISGSSGKIWREYANYCRARNRPRHAQKIYLRGLTGDQSDNRGAVTNETERFKLWNDFLILSRETTNDPNLTIDQLMIAVKAENNSDSSINKNGNENNLTAMDTRPTKVQKTHHEEQSNSTSVNSTNSNTLATSLSATSTYTNLSQNLDKQDSDMPMVSSSAGAHLPIQSSKSIATQIQTETAQLFSVTKGNMPPELMAAWLATDGDSPPMRPEPPLFAPSPPKLSDGSGKNILGSELALQLVRILLNKENGNLILEVCKGCWVMTALKEQETVKVIQQFEPQMRSELDLLESKLAARLSVAGPALVAVQQINDNERNEVMATWNQRQQQLLDNIAWEFRKLLAMQQNILTAAKLPGFYGATVEAPAIVMQSKICSVMHSAFFLRTRVGEAAHATMLSNLEDKLSKEKVTPPPPPPRQQNSNVVIPAQTYSSQHPHNMPPPPFNLPQVPPYPPYTGQQALFPAPPVLGIPPPHVLHPGRGLPAMPPQQMGQFQPSQQHKSQRHGGKQRAHQNQYPRQSQNQSHFR